MFSKNIFVSFQRVWPPSLTVQGKILPIYWISSNFGRKSVVFASVLSWATYAQTLSALIGFIYLCLYDTEVDNRFSAQVLLSLHLLFEEFLATIKFVLGNTYVIYSLNCKTIALMSLNFPQQSNFNLLLFGFITA